jgi:hypothetical protein
MALTAPTTFGQSYDIRIAVATDDVEEYVGTGGMSGTSTDLEIPYEDSVAAGEDQLIGLRWAIPIGAGVKVAKAYVEFNCDETKMAGTVNLIIEGQLVANAPAFTTTAKDLSNRARTKTQVKWSPEAWPTTEEKHKTADVSAIIQEIVDQPGWRSGNALVLIIRDDKSNPSQGTRCADAYEDDAASAALLHLEISKGPAGAPSPVNGAADVARDATLSWKAGENAAKHNVYFGTDLANLSSVSQGQTGTTYTPSALLAFGQTYYWRIDEVGATNTIVNGATWSFTVEAYSSPIAKVTATASSSQLNMGPDKTVDGSGLTGDLHSDSPSTMWLSMGTLPNWIQYEFDAVYKLDKLLVWNSNQMIEAFIGFGAKDVTVEYSVDGVTWTTLAGVPQFSQATGSATYAANTTVNFGGIAAKYVKLTIATTWGGISPTAGLSEVRFLSIPVQAKSPQPANAATGVAVDAPLSWRAGREAKSHKVFLDADQAAVAAGTAPAQTVTDPSYTPSALAFGTTYYWRVDEVNTVAYPGSVWSFTTESCAVVEGFDSYNDDDNRIYDTWIDGLTDGKSGSQVGYNTSPFAELTIIHGGTKAMPFLYNNSGAVTTSEATRTFAPAQDWTRGASKTLVLFLYGDPANTGGQVYLKINGTKVPFGTANTVKTAGWTQYNIDLPASVSLKAVRTLTLGVEGSGKGTLFVDDLLLYANAPVATGGAALDVRLATSTDDMEEYVSTGAISTTSSDLELPYEDVVGDVTDLQLVGVRYLLALPKGAKIGKAYVEFTCDETKSGTLPVNLVIEGQLIVNAPVFSSTAKDISNRTTRTKAQVKWAVDNWTTVGQKSQTPDLAAIIQELVNQSSWASGNAIVLIFSDDKSNPSTGIRCADAYEDSATTCPVLHLEIVP